MDMFAEYIFAANDFGFLRDVIENYTTGNRTKMGKLIVLNNSRLPQCLKEKRRDEILCSSTAYGTLMRTILEPEIDCVHVQVDHFCEN